MVVVVVYTVVVVVGTAVGSPVSLSTDLVGSGVAGLVFFAVVAGTANAGTDFSEDHSFCRTFFLVLIYLIVEKRFWIQVWFLFIT